VRPCSDQHEGEWGQGPAGVGQWDTPTWVHDPTAKSDAERTHTGTSIAGRTWLQSIVGAPLGLMRSYEGGARAASEIRPLCLWPGLFR